MTKEELRQKYHGKVVSIRRSVIERNQREFDSMRNVLKNACGEIGLRVVDLEEQAHVMGMSESLFALSIPDVPAPDTVHIQSPIELETFLGDFGLYVSDERDKEVIVAKEILKEFNVEYDFIEKKRKGFTSSDVIDEGFIQAQTTNKASLWWHVGGRMVLFVRGEGAFEVTARKEE